MTGAGERGAGLAWVAEYVISFILMFVLLAASNTPRVARFTGSFVGAFIIVMIEAGLVATGDHISKTVVLADPHTLFVNIGSASNARCRCWTASSRCPRSQYASPTSRLSRR